MRLLKINLVISFILINSLSSMAQSSKDLLVSGSLDVIKTDYSRFLGKAQIGFEGNYFLLRQFSASAGAEIWTGDKSSFMMGMRWYPQDHFFFRFRGLIGQNDVAIGGGWAKPFGEGFRFEAMGDFYVDRSEFAIRAGIGYVIKQIGSK
jgi:hypothetical protein